MTLHAATINIVAPIFLAACWTTPSFAEVAATGRPTMLVHGNYCGMGNNAPLPPVDALDAACARHDACTPDDDLPTKACNFRLEQEAQAIADDLSQPADMRMMAGLVAAFASTTPSKPILARAPVALGPTRLERSTPYCGEDAARAT